MSARKSAVWIRVSTSQQDENAQIKNVGNLLDVLEVDVPNQNWFKGNIVSRRDVATDPNFKKLMALVVQRKFDVVYIESHDRSGIGTRNTQELFNILTQFRDNETQLYDLQAGRNLANDGFMDELLALFAAHQSKEELKKIAERSMRTKVNNFIGNGSWPTGPVPFGYGKACFSPSGEKKWEWYPISRNLGHTYRFVNGKPVKESSKASKQPKKSREERIQLVPHIDGEHIETIKLAFELYGNSQYSLRQVAIDLNSSGRRYYEKEFTHSLVTTIIDNAVYVGETHFGKTLTAKYATFDSNKEYTIQNFEVQKKQLRKDADRVIKAGTHEPLISRELWARVKKRREDDRKVGRPKNPNYFLRPLLVCGHCGKNMTGRTERAGDGGQRIGYVCSAYQSGRSVNQNRCGYHFVHHDVIESILFEKIRELDIPFEPTKQETADSIKSKKIKSLICDLESREFINETIEEGVKSFINYLNETPNAPKLGKDLESIEKAARRFYRFGSRSVNSNINSKRQSHRYDLQVFKKAVTASERHSMEYAKQKCEELQKEHDLITSEWINATERMKESLQRRIEVIESQLDFLEPRRESISTRLARFKMEMEDKSIELVKRLEEFEKLPLQEKASALSQIFNKVTLFWSKTHHERAKDSYRTRKTNRNGRFSYTLLEDKIEYDLNVSTLEGSW